MIPTSSYPMTATGEQSRRAAGNLQRLRIRKKTGLESLALTTQIYHRTPPQGRQTYHNGKAKPRKRKLPSRATGQNSAQGTKTKKDLPTLLSREIQVKSPKISIGELLTARYLLQLPHGWGLSTARMHSCTHLASFLILIESRRMVRLKIFYSPHRCPVANIHQQRQA